MNDNLQLKGIHDAPWRVKKLDGESLSYLIPDANPRTNAGKMTATVTVSTETVDRDGDVILSKGVDWSDHKMNPIVFLLHKPMYLTGMAEDSFSKKHTLKQVGTNRWDATTHFSKNTQLGEEGFRLVEEGIFRGASVGFPPSSAVCQKRINPNGWEGKMYTYIKPLEYSHLPHMSNPDCIVRVVEKGFGGRKLSEPLWRDLNDMLPERNPVVQSGWSTSTPLVITTTVTPAPQPADTAATTVRKAMQPEDTLAGGGDEELLPPDAQAGDDESAAGDENMEHGDIVDRASREIAMSLIERCIADPASSKPLLKKLQTLLGVHSDLKGAGEDAELPDLDEEADPTDVDSVDTDEEDESTEDSDGDGVADSEDDHDSDPKKKKKPFVPKSYDAWTDEGANVITKAYKFVVALANRPTPQRGRQWVDQKKVERIASELMDEMTTYIRPVQKMIADASLVTKANEASEPELEKVLDLFTELSGHVATTDKRLTDHEVLLARIMA